VARCAKEGSDQNAERERAPVGDTQSDVAQEEHQQPRRGECHDERYGHHDSDGQDKGYEVFDHADMIDVTFDTAWDGCGQC
jgi:hypothetical protein